jgi:N-dimethylarginine dimethylaminohydrolase
MDSFPVAVPTLRPAINRTVLMSGAEFFSDQQAINAYMDTSVRIDVAAAAREHSAIRAALELAGVAVIAVDPPRGCQDGVYTANWALVRGDRAVLSTLPSARKGEEPYAEEVLRGLGKEVVRVPEGVRFSGQGDALPCGDYLLAGSGYRTELPAHRFVADQLGYRVVPLQTVPKRGFFGWGRPVINADSGWPDSYFYDIDLAIAVLRDDLIAWCPDAFTAASRRAIRALDGVETIEVTYREATRGFACNLVSTGETVIMSAQVPRLQAAIEARGLTTIPLDAEELRKGGGYIRCCTLTLDND